jgi:hypothetical protein
VRTFLAAAAVALMAAVSCGQGEIESEPITGAAGELSATPTATDSPSGTSGFVVEPPTTRVPDIAGLELDRARTLLVRASLDADVERRYSNLPKGSVLDQDPASGARVAEGTVVLITVAEPLPQIPDVVGLTIAQAERSLRQAGFDARVVRSGTTGIPGTVTAQTPAAGVGARPGREVRITTPNCTAGYSPCLPPASDYDCAGGSGDGPKYTGFVRVTGSDPYGLDADNDGYGCE